MEKQILEIAMFKCLDFFIIFISNLNNFPVKLKKIFYQLLLILLLLFFIQDRYQ